MDAVVPRIDDEYPCRQSQIKTLSTILSIDKPPPGLIIYGPQATCKSTLTPRILRDLKIPHAIIQSRECITGRHLLEQTVSSCIDALESSTSESIDRSRHARCENLSALMVHLQVLLKERGKFVLVFDGIDKQREAPPTLLPALARAHEMIPNLMTIFILSHASPRILHTAGVPHLHFPPYTRDESLAIVSRDPPSIFQDQLDNNEEISSRDELKDVEHADEHRSQEEKDSAWLWSRYCRALWDSLAKSAARDVVSFRELAERMWPRFVSGIVDGTYGPRDFSRLMVARRALFQDESSVVVGLVDNGDGEQTTKRMTASHDLPHHSKYLLCAVYLGSYNPPRTDPTHFMKSTEKKRKRKNIAGTPGRAAKHRKIPRRHLPPSACALERLLAIFHAITPHTVSSTADLYTQLATLATLRLVLKVGPGDALDINGDGRWKVNVGWEYAAKVGRGLGLDLEEWCTEF